MSEPTSFSQVTALVPAYNEEKRIGVVLRVLLKLGLTVVVVDDGSSDRMAQVVRDKFSQQVTLVELEENLGKVGAVKAGLKRIQAKYVLLCDADLSNLKIDELQTALTAMQNPNSPAMIILKRVHETQYMLRKAREILHLKKLEFSDLGLTLKPKIMEQLSCLLSGERLVQTRVLAAALANGAFEAYGLEVALNQYCLENGLSACWLPSTALSSLKIEELGMLPMLTKYLSMHLSLVQQLGAKNFLRQLNSFCKQRCKL